MTGRQCLAVCGLAAGAVLLAPACGPHKPASTRPPSPPASARQAPAPPASAPTTPLAADLDAVFDDPVLARALISVRVDSLGPSAATLYERDNAKLVMPASNMKILTLAVAADRLGWDYRYDTRLEAAGPIDNGVLQGDLVVVGAGDPSIVTTDGVPPAFFQEWADALRQAGIQRVDGRIIGDDDVFDDEGLGPGWSWDYLQAGYAAPSSGLNYNENQVAIRITPGATAGSAARFEVSPAGHGLSIVNAIVTGEPGSAAVLDLARLPGKPELTLRGSLPAGSGAITRTASVDNPTRFFVEALRLALEAGGLAVRDEAFDLDDVRDHPPAAERRVIAAHQSPPLSELAHTIMKLSLNFDTEAVLKTIGSVATMQGTTAAGREAARQTLDAWSIPLDGFVLVDGSGLSRYNYVSADAIVGVLTHVWQDDRLRDPFIAALPVAGHDGTLASRMRGTALDGKVEAKTGTIANVRALSGYLETKSGEHLVFSMIANNFTVPSAAIDAVVERALLRLAGR